MFIYSLPLLFNLTDFGSPLELLIIFATLFAVLHLSAPIMDEELEDKPFNYPLYQYMLYVWTGRLALWRVFWPFFLILNLGLFGADYAVRVGEISVSSWDDVHIMLVVFGIIWTVGVWRNSINSQSRTWVAYARLMTLAMFFEFGIKIFLRMEYPRILFNCVDRILDYLVCF
ncbi:MAG: hypothetical protein GQ569_12515 [Methylococcaceae bacterium]|nr:hypothetical protein [Methylococcaceae bacterium]